MPSGKKLIFATTPSKVEWVEWKRHAKQWGQQSLVCVGPSKIPSQGKFCNGNCGKLGVMHPREDVCV